MKLPGGVEHAAVASTRHQAGGGWGWGTGSGDERTGSFQEGVCMHGLHRYLLKTVCC